METARELDAFIDSKLGNRTGAFSRELSLFSETEYFLFIKATIRMLDEEDNDNCPFLITLASNPQEVRNGRFMVPNGYIQRR